MILDLEGPAPLPERARHVIIGAGAVGLILAVTLARRGESVLVLESGGRSFDTESQALNEAEIAGRAHLGVTEGRARLLGGTTHLWGGQLVAFDEMDFEARPWLGLEAWPVNRGTLDPWYSAAADILGLGSLSSDDTQVWGEIGLSQPDLGPGFSTLLTRWLKEPNFARLFARDLKDSRNLVTVLHATAADMRIGADGRVEAVQAIAPSGKTAWFEGENIIVACGTIEASHLMLVVADKRRDAPWADNPWVGRGFQDHLDAPAARVEITDRKRFSDSFDNIVSSGFKYQPKIKLEQTLYRDLEISNIAASFTYNSSLTENLAKVKHAVRSLISGNAPEDIPGLLRSMGATIKIWGPLISRYVRDRRILNVGDLGVQLNLHCEQIPLAQSRISLSSEGRDPLGLPKVVLDWKVDGRELAAMKLFAERLDGALQAAGLARLHFDPALWAGDASFLDLCKDTNHHCGGLRMAGQPADGVVDANLKVYGTTNLYVAGASVFPSSSFANPTFTAMAFAMRLAGHLKDGQ